MKIAFASCYHPSSKEPKIWRKILNCKPDLLLLLGDNVYTPGIEYNKSTHETKYTNLFADKYFAEIMCKVPHLAIWDDHDFGTGNSCGAVKTGPRAMYAHRDESRKLFNQYMHSPLNNNAPEVYCSIIIGDVKIIMLDTRYYREEGGQTATLLGKKQEKWLKRELRHNGKFTIICSGSCYQNGGNGESWTSYPQWCEKFIPEIKKSPRPLFLSGNIHKNKFITWIRDWRGKIRAGRWTEKLLPNDLCFHEVISSGIGAKGTINGVVKSKNNYGIIEIGRDEVKITLSGRLDRDKIKKTIDVHTWKVRPQ
jgi:alkaline phosphatase D